MPARSGWRNNSTGAAPSEVALLKAGSKPLSYLASFPVLDHLVGVSGAPDNTWWVLGGEVPADQYGRGECGPPELQRSVPARQQVIATRTLLVATRCNEACTVRASGTLSVPGGAARTFKLRSAKRRLAAGRRARLKLGVSRKAAGAMRRAKRRGQSTRFVVRLRATDAGQTESWQQLRLTIR